MPGMTRDIRAAGRSFIEREGRLVERRLAAVLFDDAEESIFISVKRNALVLPYICG